ncbi:putative deoxyribonuclease TATDN3-like protein [Ramicandelaber brevisporus]|nr:putative deoxyribonuclease TATDN3-like protein [Ramicandelaber brevisporus]
MAQQQQQQQRQRRLVDCHAHLVPRYFEDTIDAVLERARDAGVVAVMAVSESPEDVSTIASLSQTNTLYSSMVVQCAGIHPMQESEHKSDAGGPRQYYSATMDQVDAVTPWIRDNAESIAAIGEIGLDFSPHTLKLPGAATSQADEAKESQRQVFRSQLSLASSLGLPINVHSRQAGHHAITEILAHSPPISPSSVLLHAFDGRPAVIKDAVSKGFMFSVAPHVTFRDQVRKLVELVPIEQLVLESDAPALGPAKGENNEPANVAIACREVAQIKGMTEDEVAEITTKNALKLFPRLARLLEK